MPNSSFLSNYLSSFSDAIFKLDESVFEAAVAEISLLKKNSGRMFILGLGGSAANASHAVNDFRKIAGIEAYAPTDNIAEFSARVNDNGLETVMSDWLIGSKLAKEDVCLFFSVGGGDSEKNVSVPLILALDLANKIGAASISIVGKDQGFLQSNSKITIKTEINSNYLTPHAETFQALLWHAMVFHPLLQQNSGKWESLK